MALAAVALAGGVLAQEPAAPLGQFFGPMIHARPTVSRCAVPLIEMKAPKATDPAMVIAPRQMAPMPQAQLPPACQPSLSR
jgi:hypothetical protein